MSSVDLLKAGDFDGIRTLVDGALKAGQDKNVGHEYNKDIEERILIPTRSILAAIMGTGGSEIKKLNAVR